MLVFPDPSVSTEYTDPNGSVWEFNNTGWVRQPDCSNAGGGGGGGGGGASYEFDVPLAFEPVGPVAYQASVDMNQKTGSPVCFGNDIYWVWWTGSGNNFGWARWTLAENGTATFAEEGVSTAPFGYSVVTNDKKPWNVVYKNFAFRSWAGAGGDVYIKQEADKSLSFGRLSDDLKWSNSSGWFNFTVVPEACFVTSNDYLCFVVRSSAFNYAGFCTLYVSESTGNLARWRNCFQTLTDTGYTSSYRVAVTEADYGFGEPAWFLLQTGCAASTQAAYVFASVNPVSRAQISRASKTAIIHDTNQTASYYPGVAVRYKNNRGAMWIGGTSQKHGTIAAPVVSEAGVISFGIPNQTHLGHNVLGSNSPLNWNSTDLRGIGAVGSTCGVYVLPQSKFGTTNQYPMVPMVLTGETFLVNGTNPFGTYQIHSTDMVFCPNQVSGEPLVRVGDTGYWICSYYRSAGKYMYLWKPLSQPTTFEIERSIVLQEEQERIAEEERLKELEEQSE